MITELLKTIPDKFQHTTTTSHIFKRDLYEYFDKPEFKDLVCVEIGSNLGYTTKILSYLFAEVIGINKEEADRAEEFNSDRENVRFYTLDVYNQPFPIDYGDVFLVDAMHTYDAVIDDTLRSIKLNSNTRKYFIYDDYGAFPEVKNAIDDLIKNEIIDLVKYIGHDPTSKFTRPLIGYEGLICKEH